jgi:uncharacterized protein (TIGR02996 family)
VPVTRDDTFLQAIIENPDDDTPRLVYADFLDARGDPRGEFIRVQCQLALLPADDPRRTELEAVERRLLKEHDREWAAPLLLPLAGMVTHWGFRRGFIEELAVEARGLQLHADIIFRLAPVRQLTLYLARSRIAALASLPHLSRVTALYLRGNKLGDRGVGDLAFSPYLGRLASLDLELNDVGDAGVGALAASPTLPRLTDLCLSVNSIGDPGALALVSCFPHLKSLELYRNPIGEEGRRALQERFGDRVRLSEATPPHPGRGRHRRGQNPRAARRSGHAGGTGNGPSERRLR